MRSDPIARQTGQAKPGQLHLSLTVEESGGGGLPSVHLQEGHTEQEGLLHNSKQLCPTQGERFKKKKQRVKKESGPLMEIQLQRTHDTLPTIEKIYIISSSESQVS